VLKGGSWYLAGQVDGSVRTYRVARVLDCNVLDERFVRPADFDLAAYWQAANDPARSRDASEHRHRAAVAVRHKTAQRLEPALRETRTRIEETADAAGWRIAVVPIGKTVWHAAAELLRLGAEAEVLAPAELRDKMAELTEAMAARYRRRNMVTRMKRISADLAPRNIPETRFSPSHVNARRVGPTDGQGRNNGLAPIKLENT
jgi:predicted DNA-binding transcriptional regulator YafY